MKTYEEIINSEEFNKKLKILNGRVKQSLLDKGLKPVIIGNLFYDHIEKYGIPFYESDLNEECDQKRRRFFKAAQLSNNMFEIGLNAGHSSFLALMANPNIKVISNDLAEPFRVHPEVYTIVAAKTLKEMFGDRFNFIKGDCITEVPNFVAANKNVQLDLLHIDGAKQNYKQDFINLSPLLKKDSLIIFDDFQNPIVKKQIKELTNEGYLEKEEIFPQMDSKKYRLTNEIIKYKSLLRASLL